MTNKTDVWISWFFDGCCVKIKKYRWYWLAYLTMAFYYDHKKPYMPYTSYGFYDIQWRSIE